MPTWEQMVIEHEQLKVKCLMDETHRLRQENQTLKSQVSDLLHECHLRDKYPHSWQEHLDEEE